PDIMSLAQGYGNGRSIATSALRPEVACRIVPGKSLSKLTLWGKQHEPHWSLARMAAGASDRQRCRIARTDRLSRPAGEDHRPDRSRRQLRSGRAATCRRLVEADGASLRRREQAGRRHRRRYASRKPE